MSQEDIFPSQVSIYVCVVSLITNCFRKCKPIRLFKPLRKRELSYFQSGGQWVCNENMLLNNNICLERSLRCWTS